jgi:hypothetical protein
LLIPLVVLRMANQLATEGGRDDGLTDQHGSPHHAAHWHSTLEAGVERSSASEVLRLNQSIGTGEGVR